MKKILFAALSATILFASCAKDGNEGKKNDETGTVTVSLKGSGGTRADNGVTIDTENASIFLFQGNTLVDKIYLSAKGSHTFENVTTGTNAVYVVGNAGNIIGSVTDLASLKGLKHTLVANIDATNKLVLQGNAVITFTAVGENLEARPSVTLRPLAARIDVKVKSTSEAAATLISGTKLTVHDVSLLYSALENSYAIQSGTLGGDGSDWVNSPAEGAADYAYYRSGLDPVTYQTSWLLNSNNSLYTGAGMSKSIAMLNVINGNFAETFYGYPGKGAYGKHAIITLRGTWDGDEGAEPIFFSAHFKNYGGVPLFENGRYYTITLTLGGKYNDKKDDTGGNPDPEDENNTGNVIIEIEDGEWIVVPPSEVIFQ